MKCILRRCKQCTKFRLFDEEKITDCDPKISFHFLQKVAKCSVHGIFRDGSDFCPDYKTETCKQKIGTYFNRKQIILLTRSFPDFIEHYYRPTLENMHTTVHILYC